jgi:hypothetical protein
VAKPSPSQIAWRRRIEAALRVAAPFLDLVLLAGDRVSRLVERQDPEQLPPLPAPRGRPLGTVGPGAAD